jgi:hypothetical protein
MAVPHTGQATHRSQPTDHDGYVCLPLCLSPTAPASQKTHNGGLSQVQELRGGPCCGPEKTHNDNTRLLSSGWGRDISCKQMLMAVLAGKVSQGAAVVPPVSSDREAGSPHEQWLMGMGASCSIGDPPPHEQWLMVVSVVSGWGW